MMSLLKHWRIILAGIGGGFAALVIVLSTYAYSLGPVPLGRHLNYSHLVLDRHGYILRAYTTPSGRWRLPATVKDVDPLYLKMLFAYEDKRFYEHCGVDPLALVRAAFQLVTQWRIVSGGSTLTMQVARLLEPRAHRSFGAKLRQIVRALEIEHYLSKNQILSLYLTIAPYGGNLEGIRAASLAYFGKEPRRLTVAQAALLVALPQSPELRRPDRHPKAAFEARNIVLDRMLEDHVLPADEVAHAKREPVPHRRKELPMLAPRAADRVVSTQLGIRVRRLMPESNRQKRLQELARERAQAPWPEVSVAILVVNNKTGEVLAHVGSADYFDVRWRGQIDVTEALRSPGPRSSRSSTGSASRTASSIPLH